MKHALAYVAALLCFAIATFVLWTNRTQLATSMPLLAFVSGFYLLSFGLAIPANIKSAAAAVAGAVQAIKGGGA